MRLTEQPPTAVRKLTDGQKSNLRRCTARHIDRSVRDLPLKAKVKDGQIIVEQGTCGIVFSFPSAVWPKDASKQWQWIERLTPWWDAWLPDWTPKAHRLRESCVKAINVLLLCQHSF